MMSMPSGTGAESTSVRPGPASQSGVGHPGAGQSGAADRLAQINIYSIEKMGTEQNLFSIGHMVTDHMFPVKHVRICQNRVPVG